MEKFDTVMVKRNTLLKFINWILETNPSKRELIEIYKKLEKDKNYNPMDYFQ